MAYVFAQYFFVGLGPHSGILNGPPWMPVATQPGAGRSAGLRWAAPVLLLSAGNWHRGLFDK